MMNTAVIENKKTLEEICGFSAKGAWRKLRELRARYGVEELCRLTGMSRKTLYNLCSEEYAKKHKMLESTWEKYFGKWGLKDPEFPNADLVEETDDVIEQAIDAGVEVMIEVEEPEDKKEPVAEAPKQARLILEVPSLEELDAALERFGFRMIIE